jgi:hypothetical protein
MVRLLKNSLTRISESWYDHFGQPRLTSPTWALDQAQLSGSIVYWPAEYQWPPSAVFLDAIRVGIAHWAKLERRAIPQPYKGVCVFELDFKGGNHRIAVDYSDYVDRIEKDCLAEVSLYFKMQCLQAGYNLPENERRKVLPGGYVMGDRRLTGRLPAIRAAAVNVGPRADVYGRFGLDFAKEIRSSVVEQLKNDPTLGYQGGMKKVPYRQSLIDAARAKICIDLPGNGDICFRFFDYLAVGAFIIAYPHRTALPSPLIDRHHLVYMKADLSDVVPLCHYYLQHEEERLAIRANVPAYFDNFCQHRQLGSWYLQNCLKLVTGALAPSAADPLPSI